MSGNTAGATFFSDGSQIVPMLPEIPNLTKCPKCNTILWLSDLKELGRSQYGYDEPDNPKWHNADYVDFLELKDLWQALRTGYYSEFDLSPSEQKQRKIFIRQRIWWKYNGEGFKNIDEIDDWHQNCLDLLSVLDLKDNDQLCMAAELHRNLCDFSNCLELINRLPEKYKGFKERMIEECENSNPLTVNLSKKKKKIETEGFYDILLNNENELLFCISEYESEPGSPELFYDGSSRALLYRNHGQVVVLENVHQGVRKQLTEVNSIWIAEISKDKKHTGSKGVIREYTVEVNVVNRLPEERGIEPLLPDNDIKKEISTCIAEKITQDDATAKNALEFYKNIAENCNIEAQYILGELYLSEQFYNLSEAVRWFEYAAFQGHKAAIAEIQSLENDDGRYDAWV